MLLQCKKVLINKENTNMEETKTCPYCGEEILAVAKKCKHCGEWLEGEPANEMQETAAVINHEPMQEPEVEPQTEMSEEDREYFDRGFIPFYSDRIWKLYRFTSEGSISRGEYWKFALIMGLAMYFTVNLLSLVLNFTVISGLGVDYFISRWIYKIPIIVACLSVTVTCTCMVIRRLHDTGKSGWLSILGFIPFINIILLVFLCQKGKAVDPKAKAKVKDYVMLIGLFVVSVFIYMMNIGMTMQTVENEEIASAYVDSENDSVDKSSWVTTDYGFRIPSDFKFLGSGFDDDANGHVDSWKSASGMKVCHWLFGTGWQTENYPDLYDYVGQGEKIATVTQDGDNGVYSGTTDLGHKFMLKMAFNVIEDHSVLDILVVIYDEELDDQSTNALAGLTKEINKWGE